MAVAQNYRSNIELNNYVSTQTDLVDSISRFADELDDGETGHFVCVIREDSIWRITALLEKNVLGEKQGWDREAKYEFIGNTEEKSRLRASFSPYLKLNQPKTAIESKVKLAFQRMDQMKNNEIKPIFGKDHPTCFALGHPRVVLEDGTMIGMYLSNRSMIE